MAELLANNAASTLTAAVPDAVATTLTVANGTVFPATGNFRVIVDNELMLATARSGNTLTVTRGIEATTAVSHLNGAAITHILTKGGLDQYLTEKASAGAELGYAEITANLTVPVVAEASAVTVVSAGAITFDGTPVLIDFFCAGVTNASGATVIATLWDATTNLGFFGQDTLAGGSGVIPLRLSRRLTPSAGSHTYIVKGYSVGGGAGTVNAGAGGGAGAYPPTFIRITKV